MSQEIKQALAQLDVDNAEHWTSEGLPRLDAVSERVGTKVERKQVSEAAPGFSRAQPDIEAAPEPTAPDASAGGWNTSAVTDEGQGGAGEKEQAPRDDGQTPASVGNLTLDEDREQFMATVKEAEEKLDELRKAKVKAQKAYDTQLLHLDKLRVKQKRAFPAESQASAVRQYQERQAEARAKQASRMRELRQLGLSKQDLESLNGKG